MSGVGFQRPVLDVRTAVGEPRIPPPHPIRQLFDPRSPAYSLFRGLLKTVEPRRPELKVNISA